MVVLDASVILKWVLPGEGGTDRALRWRDKHLEGSETVAVPDLFFYEAANVLALTKRLPSETAWEVWSSLCGIELAVYGPSLVEMRRAMEIVRLCRVSAYDAYYAALAEALECRMITADGKLARRLAGSSISVETL